MSSGASVRFWRRKAARQFVIQTVLGGMTLLAVPLVLFGDGPVALESRIATDLQYLSSDELAGRAVGSTEIDRAAEYIADTFKKAGLNTQLFQDTPFQPFSVDTQFVLDAEGDNHLTMTGASGESLTPVAAQDFNPLSLGSSGAGSGGVVFAGYGISVTEPRADGQKYDDFAGIDVTDKVVIVLRKEPSFEPFGKSRPTAHSFFSTKAVNAAAHKAAAMIVVNDQKTIAGAGADTVLQVSEAGPGSPRGFKIPVFMCKREIVDKLVTAAVGKGLNELEDSINRTGQPASIELAGAKVDFSAAMRRDQVMAKNVIGELPGFGKLADETLVVGAHYDHVGMGGIGSLAPGTIAVHNGADDNGSGTVALLETVRQIVARAAAKPTEARRRIVFIAFTGEERGLLGSLHYVKSPRWPLEQTVAMVNMDMVGRLASNKLTVYGTGSGTLLAPLVRTVVAAHELTLDEVATGYGPSDHQSFYEKGVPVLHFFTGLHNDYHRPSDDFDKINLSGLTRITDIVSEVVWDLALSPERPVYQKTERGGEMRRQPRAVLGVTLKLDAGGPGAYVDGTVPEGAAAKAGLVQGDRILEVDGQAVDGPDGLRARIGAAGVGQKVRLKVDRGGQTLEIDAILLAEPE